MEKVNREFHKHERFLVKIEFTKKKKKEKLLVLFKFSFGIQNAL